MDNAPPTSTAVDLRRSDHFFHLGHQENKTDGQQLGMEMFRAPSTPKRKFNSTPESTPRARPRITSLEQTPRPLVSMSSFGDHAFSTNANTQPQPQEDSSDPQTQGFTLSHLRRVPELSALARRVVKAEAKRRAREARRRQLQSTSGGTKNVSIPGPSFYRGVRLGNEQTEMIAPKMKRLFQWAIVKLHEEGSIVLWDGSVRPLPIPLPGNESGMGSGLWQTSTASAGRDSTLFSIRTVTTASLMDEDEDELSDPPPPGADGEGEEAYIPLTPINLAPYVVRAIRALTSVAPAATNAASSGSRKLCRLRATPAPISPPGPTPREITTFLRRSDGRWARVGEWVVCDALDELKARGSVWCVGGGRWEVCL